MFQVDHFDPQAASKEPRSQRTSKKRRANSSHNGRDASSSLRVIAPEQPLANARNKLDQDEAFDDMDIVVDEPQQLLDEIGDPVIMESTSQLLEDEDDNPQQHPLGDGSSLSRQEIQAALQLSQLPIQQAAKALGLAPFLVDNLTRDGFQSFFPIQALTIPDVISQERHAYLQARDVCITAPTGSGKTLSYVLPIVNSLARRVVRRLRALLVLPSRDLALQVHQVFQQYVKGSDLRVGLAVGQSDFVAEQMALTVDPNDKSSVSQRQRLQFEPGNLELALNAFSMLSDFTSHTSLEPQQAMSSPIDILVCTPGRLVDHLESTPGFTLQHLQFICIDEADRLLNQSYHNWFDRVLASARSASSSSTATESSAPFPLHPDGFGYAIYPQTWRRVDGNDANKTAASQYCQPVQIRKFLVSATLTRNPQKLAALQLVNPRHFDLHQISAETGDKLENKKYTMPSGLAECTVECTAEQKPVVLLALILDSMNEAREAKETPERTKGIIVIFTSSLQSSHRLARLLQLLWLASDLGDARVIAEFSSSLTQKERAQLIDRCKDAKDNLSVVICSDGMSRGMDIDLVSTVINYDVPAFAKVYVHRCGRTARAGRRGTAITLLKVGQIGQFRKLRSLIRSPERVSERGIKKQLIRDVLPHYRKCVHALKQVLSSESEGELGPTQTDSLMDFLETDTS